MAAPGLQHQESFLRDAAVPPTHTKISSQPTEPCAPTSPSWIGSLSTLADFLKQLGSQLSLHDVTLFTFAVDGGHDHDYALFAWGRTTTFFYIWLVWYFALLAVRCWMAHTFRTFYKLLKKIGVARMRDLHWANKCG